MQHAVSGLAKIFTDLLRDAPPEEAVRLAWPVVCGAQVAARARPVDFSRGLLRVEVPDKTWRAQLVELERRYVGELCELLGKDAVKRIEFVVSK